MSELFNKFPGAIKGRQAGVVRDEEGAKNTYFLEYEVVIDGVTQVRTATNEKDWIDDTSADTIADGMAAVVAADTGLPLPTP